MLLVFLSTINIAYSVEIVINAWCMCTYWRVKDYKLFLEKNYIHCLFQCAKPLLELGFILVHVSI